MKLQMKTITAMANEVSGFIHGVLPSVKGVPIKVSYWLGKNLDILQREMKHFEKMRQELIGKYGVYVYLQGGKIDEFVSLIAEQSEKEKVRTRLNAVGATEEELMKIKEEYPETGEKVDELLKFPPRTKDIIPSKNVDAFNKDFEELLALEVDINLTPLKLSDFASLEKEQGVSAFVAKAPDLFVEDEVTEA